MKKPPRFLADFRGKYAEAHSPIGRRHQEEKTRLEATLFDYQKTNPSVVIK